MRHYHFFQFVVSMNAEQLYIMVPYNMFTKRVSNLYYIYITLYIYATLNLKSHKLFL